MTDVEKLAIIQQIKQRREPPFDEWDVFNRRYPWKKFGEWYDIYREIWVWYSDDCIMANTDEEDIQAALSDIGITEGGEQTTDKLYLNGYAFYVSEQSSDVTDCPKGCRVYRFDFVDDSTNTNQREDILATFIIWKHDTGLNLSVVECFDIDNDGWGEGAIGYEPRDEYGDRYMDYRYHSVDSERSMIAVFKVLYEDKYKI